MKQNKRISNIYKEWRQWDGLQCSCLTVSQLISNFICCVTAHDSNANGWPHYSSCKTHDGSEQRNGTQRLKISLEYFNKANCTIKWKSAYLSCLENEELLKHVNNISVVLKSSSQMTPHHKRYPNSLNIKLLCLLPMTCSKGCLNSTLASYRVPNCSPE